MDTANITNICQVVKQLEEAILNCQGESSEAAQLVKKISQTVSDIENRLQPLENKGKNSQPKSPVGNSQPAPISKPMISPQSQPSLGHV